MFDGDYRGKRNINLGGNRGNQDKDALLRKAQQERQQRELERTKQRNIVKIQVGSIGVLVVLEHSKCSCSAYQMDPNHFDIN